MRYFILVTLFALIGLTTQTSIQSQSSDWPRSPTIAPHGMVATGQPLAVQIGVDILKKGGSAIDAAVAVNAALGLMEPTSCGIGGDLYALVWDNKEKKLFVFLQIFVLLIPKNRNEYVTYFLLKIYILHFVKAIIYEMKVS